MKDVTDIDGTKVDLTIDWGGKPKAFSAHGIGLHVENGERYLFAINHALPSRQVVDIFKHDRGTNTLYVLAELGSDSPIRFPFTTTRVNLFFLRTLQQTLESDKFISLNDVHPISKNQCYATNDHGVKSELMQLVTDSAGIPISSVVFHDGQNAEYVSKNFLFANGIAGYGNYIYVAETLTQKVHIFERKANGQLEFQSAKDFDSGVDNIVVDDSNNELSLVVGCHPHIFKFLAHMKGQPKIVPAPSEILRMKLSADGSSFSDENPSVLYYYNGAASSRPDNAISDEIDSIYASSVGAIVNGHLVIGTVNDKDILDCF